MARSAKHYGNFMSIQDQPLPAHKTSSNFITTGLALFCMFFGAGNLIFPLIIGKEVGQNVWYAILGLGLTAVVIPILGLVAMILFKGDYKRFFGRFGRIPGFALLLLLQLILGPWGVIPRLVTLMHASVEPYLFGTPFLLFSICMSAAIFILCIKKQRLVNVLGAYLTPVLLLSLIGLVFFGLTDGSSIHATSSTASGSFLQGLFQGYNTMDLIAAFFFASVVLPHFRNESGTQDSERSLFKKMLYSSLIAGSLLFLTYVGLCLVSAHHGHALNVAPEQMLGAIATKVLGGPGGFVAAIAVFTACLTTAITLASIFAEYLQKELCQNKISHPLALIITLVTTTLFANLGFKGIAAFLGPILQIVYPGLILLTLLNLFGVYQKIAKSAS